MAVVLKIIQKLTTCHNLAGQALVPYYRQILPSLNLFKNKTRSTMDKVSGNTRFNEDMAELINDTLDLLDQTGGENAYVHIKYMVPTYQRAV